MTLTLLLQQVLNGLLDGVYYLLIALGLSLIFSLGGIVNLAHGAFYAMGAYLTVTLTQYIGFGGSFVVAPISVAFTITPLPSDSQDTRPTSVNFRVVISFCSPV